MTFDKGQLGERNRNFNAIVKLVAPFKQIIIYEESPNEKSPNEKSPKHQK